MKYILAIDQGTTGSRAVVYDRAGRIAASAYEEFPQYFPKPGWVEHDPEEIWKSVDNSIQKVLKKVSSDHIKGIGITNQRETVVVWDRITGRPVHNAIVWQCRRTSARCGKLKKDKKISNLIKQRTGLPVDAYFSASKIEWILDNIKGAKKKAGEGRLLCGTTDAWILWKLTGGREHATDHTNASRTMLYNINTLKWDKKLLSLFNVPEIMLPEVKSSCGSFGETVKKGKLHPGIPISGIAGDQQAALFGQACFSPGTIKNTYGTGCFVLLNSGKKRPSSKCGLITTLGCGPKGEPVYVLEGAVFIAGAAVQWLRDGLGILKKAGEAEKMALRVDDNQGVYFVPALVGLGAPYWDPSARGLITGITRGTGSGHIARAAIEAMCYQTRDVLDVMKKITGLKINDLKVDGGAVVMDLLCRFQADILGIDVVRPEVIETTSLGAAYLAGLSLGYWKNSSDISKCWKKDKIFKPKMKKKKADELYDGWNDAVKRTLNK